jgi:hypothetical protein
VNAEVLAEYFSTEGELLQIDEKVSQSGGIAGFQPLEFDRRLALLRSSPSDCL